jgi:hypothetical protein
MNCFKIVIADPCFNPLYTREMSGLDANTPLANCFVWNNPGPTPPPMTSPPFPPDVPAQGDPGSGAAME